MTDDGCQTLHFSATVMYSTCSFISYCVKLATTKRQGCETSGTTRLLSNSVLAEASQSCCWYKPAVPWLLNGYGLYHPHGTTITCTYRTALLYSYVHLFFSPEESLLATEMKPSLEVPSWDLSITSLQEVCSALLEVWWFHFHV